MQGNCARPALPRPGKRAQRGQMASQLHFKLGTWTGPQKKVFTSQYDRERAMSHSKELVSLLVHPSSRHFHIEGRATHLKASARLCHRSGGMPNKRNDADGMWYYKFSWIDRIFRATSAMPFKLQGFGLEGLQPEQGALY